MYEGVIIDIDYILSTMKKMKINFDKTIKLINVLVKNNIPVVLYTENSRACIDEVKGYLKTKEPAIVAEGAQIYSPFDTEYESVFPLDINTVCKLGNWALNQNLAVNINTDEKNMSYLEWVKGLKCVNYRNANSSYSKVVNIEMHIENDDKRIELLNFIGKNNLECYAHMYLSHVSCINSMVDKGNTLRYLASKKRWDIKKFVMVGEYFKDSSIFDEIGYGMSISDFHRNIFGMFEKNFDNNLANII